MKKVITILFILSSMCVMGNEENNITALDKEVQGVNKEQLEIREIPTEEVILTGQEVETGAIKVTNDNYQNQNQKIKVVQRERAALEDELSQGLEEKSIWKYIIGGLGVVALIIAL